MTIFHSVAAAAQTRLSLHKSHLPFHSPRRGPQSGYRAGGIRLCLKSRQSPPDRGSHCTKVFLGPSSLHSPRRGPQSGYRAGGIQLRLKSRQSPPDRGSHCSRVFLGPSSFFTLTLPRPLVGVLRGRYPTSFEVKAVAARLRFTLH
jgi:hypothetical protein